MMAARPSARLVRSSTVPAESHAGRAPARVAKTLVLPVVRVGPAPLALLRAGHSAVAFSKSATRRPDHRREVGEGAEVVVDQHAAG
jgi:hypothetical protein